MIIQRHCPLHIFLILLGLLLVGCHPVAAPTISPLPAPPIWQTGGNPSDHLHAATEHATHLLNHIGADEDRYLAQMQVWGVDTKYLWLRTIDIDNDGQLETLMSYPFLFILQGDVDSMPACVSGGCPRYIFIFEGTAGAYHPGIYVRDPQQDADLRWNQATIFAADDINADGQTEVVIEERWQGAHTTGITITTLRWAGDTWRQLGWIHQGYSTVQLLDIEGDGPQEFVVYGGTAGSAGAGYQRKTTFIYKWDGNVYKLTASIPDAIASDKPYWKIVDGTIALFQRRIETADQLFNEAVEMLVSPSPDGSPASVDLLLAIAQFQAMYVAQIQNHAVIVDSHYRAGKELDEPYATWFTTFEDTFTETSDLERACTAVRDLVGERSIEGYNYGTNPLYVRNLLCAPPGHLTPE